MNLPKTVKIGQRTIKIELRNFENDQAMSDHFGYTLTDSGTVVLRDSAIPAIMRSTLLHELLHAILSVYEPRVASPKKVEEYEEWAVSILEEPLITMLRENPELVEYLLSSDVPQPAKVKRNK